MIRSFRDRLTAELFHGESQAELRRVPPEVVRAAQRKLAMVDAAERLSELRVPPGNRLEALKGDLKGWHSIRVNDQWRIIFRWDAGGAHEVGFADYHR